MDFSSVKNITNLDQNEVLCRTYEALTTTQKNSEVQFVTNQYGTALEKLGPVNRFISNLASDELISRNIGRFVIAHREAFLRASRQPFVTNKEMQEVMENSFLLNRIVEVVNQRLGLQIPPLTEKDLTPSISYFKSRFIPGQFIEFQFASFYAHTKVDKKAFEDLFSKVNPGVPSEPRNKLFELIRLGDLNQILSYADSLKEQYPFEDFYIFVKKAVSSGNIPLVTGLLDKFGEKFSRIKILSLFLAAVKSGNLDLVTKLQERYNISLKELVLDDEGLMKPLLNSVVRTGQLEIIKDLLAKVPRGEKPRAVLYMTDAVNSEELEVVKFIGLNCREEQLKSFVIPFGISLELGLTSIAKYLWEHVKTNESRSIKPGMYAAGCPLEVYIEMEKELAWDFAKDQKGQDATLDILRAATSNSNVELLRYLEPLWKDVLIEEKKQNDKNFFNENSLVHHACASGSIKSLRYLVEELGFKIYVTGKNEKKLFENVAQSTPEIYAYLLSFWTKKPEDKQLLLKIADKGLKSLSPTELKNLGTGVQEIANFSKLFKKHIAKARREQIMDSYLEYLRQKWTMRLPTDIAKLIWSKLNYDQMLLQASYQGEARSIKREARLIKK